MKFNYSLPKTAHLHLRKEVKLPSKPSKKLARIFGELLGDGHLQVDHGLISFYSKDIKQILDFESRIYSLFGIKGNTYKKKNKKADFRLFFTSMTLAEFFYHIGMPSGSKTDQEFLIPNWIMGGSKRIKANFLSGFFDSEGCIYFNKIPNNRIRWRMYLDQHKRTDLKENGVQFMDQIRSLLIYFHINPQNVSVGKGKTRKNGIKTNRLSFGIEKSSFMNFYKHIGFRSPYKQKKLIVALNHQ